MTTSSDQSNCPKCGAPIPEEAPAGLCPRCVLGGAATAPDRGNPTMVSGGARVAPPAIDEIAPHFPELEILELVGAGGMGAVYKVRQPKLDRMVALKILTQDLAADPAFVERFNREARVLAKLSHPNIVTIYDFGTAGPFCFLMMEFVDGVNLRQAMRDGGGFTPTDSLALVGDVCEALGFAHEEGVMHRDIKPENILIDARGRVKIADFGIAKLVGDTAPSDVTLTLQGSILGSPQYMAPEQIETPGDVDQRADIYSLGVVFYELLTGELPLGRFAAPSEKKAMDARIDEIVMRTLEKEREARFQSAGEVETRIEAISQAPASVAQGNSAPLATPASAASDRGTDDEPAKFAFASAILTSSALLIALISFFLLPILASERPSTVDRLQSVYLSLAWCTLLVGIPAILGMIFGFRALGEIRRSGGRKSGLGSAMFGAMTLPSIAVVAAIGGLIVLFLHATDTAIGSPYLIALITAIAGPLIAFSLIRRVARWARGGVKEEKPTLPGWRVALNGFLALVLAGVLYVVFFGVERSEEDTVYKEAQRSLPFNPHQELWDQHWQEGAPQFVGELSVPRGHTAKIELRRIEGGGQETITEIWKVDAPDDKDYSGVIALGAPDGLQAEQLPGVAALKSSLWNADGSNPRHYNKFYNGKLELRTRGTKIAMEASPSYETELGSCGILIEPERSYDMKISTLYLRIKSTPRATAEGSAPEAKVDLPPDTEDLPKIEIAYTAPAGRVSVFALQSPWDQSHESPDDWYVVAPDEADLQGRITFAIAGKQGVGGKTKRRVLATLLDGAGKTLATHRFFMPEDHTVSLPPNYPIVEMDELPNGEITGFAEPQPSPESIDLNREGVHMVFFGHREGSEIIDSLRLLAWSVQRPEGARIEGWMAHQFRRLGEKKWNPPVGDEEPFRIYDIEGDVRARSGMFFDTRERVLKDSSATSSLRTRVTLKQGENLLLTEGSTAKLQARSGGKFEIGPQVDEALLVLQNHDHWIMPLPKSGLTLKVDELPGELAIMVPPFANTLVIREPAAFQLGSDGQLQVWEGEIAVSLQGGEEKTVTSGQALTLPKPPAPKTP